MFFYKIIISQIILVKFWTKKNNPKVQLLLIKNCFWY